MSDYIMFMFGEHQEQDRFVEVIANDLSVIAHSDNIKFYYGQSSAIFTFKSNETLDDINEYLTMLFGDTNVVYVLLPYSSDKMSVKLPKGIYEHLFDINNGETLSGFTPTAQESYIEELNNFKNDLKFINSLDEDDEDDEILMLKNKKKEPSIDEILDKISEKGLSSLTKTERVILEKYSKTI